MIKERCSRLPLVTLCGAAIDQSFSVQGTAEYAHLGTAVHAVMASWITNGFDVEVIPRVAAQNHVSLQDLRIAVFMAWGQWQNLKEFFPEPQVEVPLEYHDHDLHLTGTTDILSIADIPTIRICDLKSGFLDTDAEQQIRGYAFCALQKYELAWEVNASIWRPRDNAIDGFTWSREELDDWLIGLKRSLNDNVFRPGRHCAYCGRGPTCEAKTAYLKQSMALVTNRHLSELPAAGPERAQALEDVLAAARMVGKMADNAQELVRAEVRAAGGSLGNMYLQTSQER